MAKNTEVAEIERVPAPLSHLVLVVLTVLPLIVPVPTNVNIVLTAAATVFCGCWRSVKPEPPAEAMTKKDAMRFPIMGSIMLFSLFLAFKFLPKDLVNLVLSAYFVLLGTAALVATAGPLLSPFFAPKAADDSLSLRIPPIPMVLKDGFEFEFSPIDAALAVPSAGFCYWYWTTKHWLANNALGIAFSLQGVEHLSLGAVQNGVILLAGLFFYDIFWVFCTPVMVSVAKSFDAPIKLLFPRVPLPTGDAPQFSMLGLGDIVIPGIFVALVLRYDLLHSRNGRPRFFKSTFAGYVLGLGTTIVVMNVFNAAQPALLYIVPAVLATTFAHAAAVGEATHLFYWQEKEAGEGEGGEKAEGVAAVDGEGDEKASGATRKSARLAKKDS